MLKFEITYDTKNAIDLEKLIVQSLSISPITSAKATKSTLSYMKQAQKAGLRITAARLRKKMLEAYDKNIFGWKPHGVYSNWLNGFGDVVVGHLTRMNRPIKKALVTTRFLRQLKGQTAYSKVKAINPPQPYPVGGRLAKATKYKVFEDNFQVGILDSASTKQKNKMHMFQDGGKVSSSTSESQRKYLAAIGIYIKRSTVLRAEARPLVEPIVAKESPDDMYAKSFAEILSGKLKIDER